MVEQRRIEVLVGDKRAEAGASDIPEGPRKADPLLADDGELVDQARGVRHMVGLEEGFDTGNADCGRRPESVFGAGGTVEVRLDR